MLKGFKGQPKKIWYPYLNRVLKY